MEEANVTIAISLVTLQESADQENDQGLDLLSTLITSNYLVAEEAEAAMKEEIVTEVPKTDTHNQPEIEKALREEERMIPEIETEEEKEAAHIIER